MLSIGEFSRVTGLTVKTLRFYHEKGLLVPRSVGAQSGYRHYDLAQVETARAVVALRSLEFSIGEIAEILAKHEDEGSLIELLERQRAAIAERADRYAELAATLERIITQEREAQRAMKEAGFEIVEKDVAGALIAGHRMRGRYRDCGAGFAKVARALGRHICGKAMLLIHDQEFREDDADFEACLPVRRGESSAGVSVRELPAARCVTLLHRGPYETLGRSYARALEHARARGYEVLSPTREVYLKGPGMIFKGNPKRYLTEIQLPVRRAAEG